jgi:hypothetical protein
MACPHSTLLAVGSASPENNLLIVDMENSSTVSHFTCPDPIFSLDVSRDMLATGGPRGVVQLFSMDSRVLDKKGKGTISLVLISQ